MLVRDLFLNFHRNMLYLIKSFSRLLLEIYFGISHSDWRGCSVTGFERFCKYFWADLHITFVIRYTSCL